LLTAWSTRGFAPGSKADDGSKKNAAQIQGFRSFLSVQLYPAGFHVLASSVKHNSMLYFTGQSGPTSP
jgi:hypothetical protein